MKKIIFLIPFLLLTTSCKSKSSKVLKYELKADDTYRVFLSETSKEKDITIPKTYLKKEVTEISGFRNNDYIETVKFYGNIKRIDDGTFTYCKNLSSIIVEDSNYYTSTNGILYKDDNLLIYPSGKLTSSITIDKNVLSKAFTLAPNLKKITIKSASVAENAFYYLENILEVTIAPTVSVIDNNFIYGNELNKLIIDNEKIASTFDVNNVKYLYVHEYQSLSFNTQAKYQKFDIATINGEVYDAYKLK